jgi:hypothetical protein
MGFTDLSNGNNASTNGGGSSKVTITNPTIGFGGIEVQTLRPVAQADFIYGINSVIFQSASFAGSSISAANGMCEINSGTELSGSAVLAIRRGVKYRPGQGSLMRGTAIFDTPGEDNEQLIGLHNEETGYSWGYLGTQFGIVHKETGQRQIKKLQITSAATNGDNISITLDNEVKTFAIAIEGTTSVHQTAYKISLQDFTNTGETGYYTDVIGDSVYFISARCNSSLTGTFSVSGGSIGGTFSTILEGVELTQTFIPTGSFNVDRLDGTGPSGMVINPQMGNVYEIDFQYLGFGNARFAVEDPLTGKFTDCHLIRNANSRTTPVLKNPNVQVRLECSNNGSTTSKTLKSASMAGYICGLINKLDPKFAKSFTFSDLKSTSYTPLAMIKANRVHRNQSCFGEFDILRLAGSNETASKTLTIGFFYDAKVTGTVNYQNVDAVKSIVSVASFNPGGVTPANSITNLASIDPFHEIVIGSESGSSEDLDMLEFIFSPGLPLLIAVKVTSGPISGTVSINWFEQQ